MFVMDVRPGAQPIMVDSGGELIRKDQDFRGRAATPTGVPRAIMPRWSPDGRWIAFLKKDGPTVQVWRAYADGSGSEQITHSDADVDDFRVTADGHSIVYSSRPALRAARDAIAREGLTGFHYDDRYSPVSGNRPFPAAPVPSASFLQDLQARSARPATAEESRLLRPATEGPDGAFFYSRSTTGEEAWTRAATSDAILPSTQLVVQSRGGEPVVCADPACDARVYRPFWMPDGRRLRYFRNEGWANGSTAIYEWIPGSGAPRRIFLTDDLLPDCEPLGARLICLRESSTSPRKIVLLDPDSGASETLFDPNPEFANLALGRVERLHLTNIFGIESIADLVLPTSYRVGGRYPLVVVQYETRGFLRGGTGDEYPIQAFANRGYAVLSFGRPEPVSLRTNARDIVELNRNNLTGFVDRRSVESSLEIAVQSLIDRGIADPARIGITGLSDGASTIEFALIHSRLFSAGAMSHCCWSMNLPMRVGPAAARYFHGQGYPQLTASRPDFWREVSLMVDAANLTTPILIQASDTEYMSALESFTALRERAAPIDMFVFPDEYHIKWQPSHRLAIYNRTLDWFDYWLRDVRPTASARSSELAHWDELRSQIGARTPAPDTELRVDQ